MAKKKKNKAPRKKVRDEPRHKEFFMPQGVRRTAEDINYCANEAEKNYKKLLKKGKAKKPLTLHTDKFVMILKYLDTKGIFDGVRKLVNTKSQPDVKDNNAVEGNKTTTGVLFSQALRTLRIGAATFRYLRDELDIKPLSRKGRGTYYAFDDMALIDALYKEKKANGTMPKLTQHYYDPEIDNIEFRKKRIMTTEDPITVEEIKIEVKEPMPDRPENKSSISIKELEDIDHAIAEHVMEIEQLKAEKKRILNLVMEIYKDESDTKAHN